MFFAKKTQKYRPAFCIKAVSFFGNDISGTDYRDSEDITGTIPEQFERGMSFFDEKSSLPVPRYSQLGAGNFNCKIHHLVYRIIKVGSLQCFHELIIGQSQFFSFQKISF